MTDASVDDDHSLYRRNAPPKEPGYGLLRRRSHSLGSTSSASSNHEATSGMTTSLSPFDDIVEPDSHGRKDDTPVTSTMHEFASKNRLYGRDAPYHPRRAAPGLETGITVSDHPKRLQRRTMALWLFSLFAIGTIFTWAITCVLVYKPVSFATYYDRSGLYTIGQYRSNDSWRKLRSVLSQILSNISIPVTSAICSKAVVVYCQKSSNRSNTKLTMRQTAALADKA